MNDEIMLPKNITVAVSSPIGGLVETVCLKLNFLTSNKNSYDFILTPIDLKDGKFILNEEKIIKDSYETAKSALMDYEPLLSVFTSDIVVALCTSIDITNILNSYKIWRTVFVYPLNYGNELKKSLKATKKLEESGEFKKLRIECSAVPNCVNFNIIQPK